MINHLQTKVIDSFCRPISTQNRVVNCYEAKLRWMTSTFSQQTLLVLFCLAKYVHMMATPSFLAQEILFPSIFGLYFSIKISVITSAIFLKFFLPYILHVNFSISIKSLLWPSSSSPKCVKAIWACKSFFTFFWGWIFPFWIKDTAKSDPVNAW